MLSILDEIGYTVMPVQVLKAINYNVPQKRELILVGVRKDIALSFEYPKPYKRVYNLSDALKKGSYIAQTFRNLKGQSTPKLKRGS
jgi:DNA (cytosine-5)-methyltransferase 1